MVKTLCELPDILFIITENADLSCFQELGCTKVRDVCFSFTRIGNVCPFRDNGFGFGFGFRLRPLV